MSTAASVAASPSAASSAGKSFDPIMRIGDLELNLTKANDRVKELEYLLAQLNEHKSGAGRAAGGAAAVEVKHLIEENVKLKSEVKKLGETKTKNTALLFSMGREHASATARLAKKASVSVTMKRLQYRAHEVQILQEELVRWLNGLIGAGAASAAGAVLKEPLTTATLLDALSTGSVLCALIRRIHPKYALGKVHEVAAKGSFFAHDNVKAFLGACQSMGVPVHALFETNDLVGTTKNTRAVVHCILSLAKVAAGPPYNIPPPDIVRIDMELDELDSKKAPAAAPLSPSKEEANKAAEKEANRLKEEAEVMKAITEICKNVGVAMPTKIKGNLFTFPSNVATDGKDKTINAYVRMLRGTPLIRLNDGWEELNAFMIQIAQMHGVTAADTPEEAAIKKRIEDATQQLTAELGSIRAHRDTLANQVTALQSSAVAAKDAKSSEEYDARVRADVAKATADLREQLLRTIEDRDRKAQDSTELATLRSTLLKVQAERDALTGQLIDANAKAASTSGDAASAQTAAQKQIAELKDQLLQAVKARDAATAEKTEIAGRLAAAEQKIAALQKLRDDDAKKAAEDAKKAVDAKSTPKKAGGARGSVGFAGDAAPEEDDADLTPEEKEKRKRREDEAAYREFFYLTALSVKMNHNASGDTIELTATSNANSTDLYERARASEVPFHQFHKWIEREITMAYLMASNQARADFNTGHHKDLRSLRATRHTVVNSRPHTNRVIEDSATKEPGFFEKLLG